MKLLLLLAATLSSLQLCLAMKVTFMGPKKTQNPENGDISLAENKEQIEMQAIDEAVCRIGRLENIAKGPEDLKEPTVVAKMVRSVAGKLKCDRTKTAVLCEDTRDLLYEYADDVQTSTLDDFDSEKLADYEQRFKALIRKGMAIRTKRDSKCKRRGGQSRRRRHVLDMFDLTEMHWKNLMEKALAGSWLNASTKSDYVKFSLRFVGALLGLSPVLAIELTAKAVVVALLMVYGAAWLYYKFLGAVAWLCCMPFMACYKCIEGH